MVAVYFICFITMVMSNQDIHYPPSTCDRTALQLNRQLKRPSGYPLRPGNIIGRPDNTSTATDCPKIQKMAGNIMRNATVYPIIFGNDITTQRQAIMKNFLTYLPGSQWFGVTKKYGVQSLKVGQWFFDSKKSVGDLMPEKYPCLITDIVSKAKQKLDPNGIYLIIFGRDVKLLHESYCKTDCGWHNFFYNGDQTIKYALLPMGCDQCNMQMTATASPNNDPDFDAMLSVMAHEISETMTDPYSDSWMDSAQQENGDKCSWTYGTSCLMKNNALYNIQFGNYKYLIQKMLDPKNNKCINPGFKGTEKCFDFGIGPC